MMKRVFSALAGLVLGLSLTTGGATAASFNAPVTIAGSSVFVTGDLMGQSNDGFLGFDLFLNIPSELLLTFIVDDAADGSGVLYQAYTPGGLFPVAGVANGFNYATDAGILGLNGSVGFRATNVTFFSGGTISEIDKIGLNFLTQAGIAPGDYAVAYAGTLFNELGTDLNQAFSGSFNIRVGMGSQTVIPLPAGGVLALSGLGALMLVRRRRRAA